MRETELYGPVKAYLEGQGYEVKGEVGAADVVARRGDDPLVVVELKTGFSLALFHQAIARLAVTDCVYVAVPKPKTKAGKENVALARRLGLGVIFVRPQGWAGRGRRGPRSLPPPQEPEEGRSIAAGVRTPARRSKRWRRNAARDCHGIPAGCHRHCTIPCRAWRLQGLRRCRMDRGPPSPANHGA